MAVESAKTIMSKNGLKVKTPNKPKAVLYSPKHPRCPSGLYIIMQGSPASLYHMRKTIKNKRKCTWDKGKGTKGYEQCPVVVGVHNRGISNAVHGSGTMGAHLVGIPLNGFPSITLYEPHLSPVHQHTLSFPYTCRSNH
jgi:hypothetical protein